MPKTIVVLGNGPSMRGLDLKRICHDTIGMNAAYRHWQAIGWYPTYYCSVDAILSRSHQEAIVRLVQETPIKRFLLSDVLTDDPRLKNNPKILFVSNVSKHPCFVGAQSMTTGSFSLRFAAYLGYQSIYFRGIDCNYIEQIAESQRGDLPNSLVIAKTPVNNPNYYFSGYQQEGDRYHIPNTFLDQGRNTHLDALKEVKAQLLGSSMKALSIAIYNTNPGSTFNLFAYKPLPSQEIPSLKWSTHIW